MDGPPPAKKAVSEYDLLKFRQIFSRLHFCIHNVCNWKFQCLSTLANDGNERANGCREIIPIPDGKPPLFFSLLDDKTLANIFGKHESICYLPLQLPI